MSKDKSPAFQWYSKDILSSARVAMMTLEEEGAYRRALDFCWLNGSLPRDPEKLAKVIGKGCSVEVANTVQQMFIIDKKNSEQILHERLEVERKKQREFRVKKSKAGTASGASRRKKNKLSPEQVLNSVDDVFEQNANKTRTKTNSSSSSSSSSSEFKNSSKSNADAAAEKQEKPKPKFTLEVYRKYVEYVAPIRKNINNPEGLARKLFATGDSDGEVEEWVESQKGNRVKESSPVDPEIRAAMARRRANENGKAEVLN
jgi:uncharacterized protein YdaU (DUF1376 family)